MWPLRSDADLLTVISDIIAWGFDSSGATQAVALNRSKIFDCLACWFCAHFLWTFGWIVWP